VNGDVGRSLIHFLIRIDQDFRMAIAIERSTIEAMEDNRRWKANCAVWASNFREIVQLDAFFRIVTS
jgi:hypothetical protein